MPRDANRKPTSEAANAPNARGVFTERRDPGRRPAAVASADVHELRRGTKYAIAHYFRMILANDDRPHTMHAEAEHTDRELLPEIVGRLLDRHDARRAARRQAWRDHTAAQRAFYERYKHLAADIGCAAQRGMDRDYGLEL